MDIEFLNSIKPLITSKIGKFSNVCLFPILESISFLSEDHFLFMTDEQHQVD